MKKMYLFPRGKPYGKRKKKGKKSRFLKPSYSFSRGRIKPTSVGRTGRQLSLF